MPHDDVLAALEPLAEREYRLRRCEVLPPWPTEIATALRRAWMDGCHGSIVLASPDRIRPERLLTALGLAWDRLANDSLLVGAERYETDAGAWQWIADPPRWTMVCESLNPTVAAALVDKLEAR